MNMFYYQLIILMGKCTILLSKTIFYNKLQLSEFLIRYKFSKQPATGTYKFKLMASKEKQCCFCKNVSTGKKRCSRCKTAVYCDADCQRQDWKAHQPFCKVEQKQIPKAKEIKPYQGAAPQNWERRFVSLYYIVRCVQNVHVIV